MVFLQPEIDSIDKRIDKDGSFYNYIKREENICDTCDHNEKHFSLRSNPMSIEGFYDAGREISIEGMIV